MPQSEPAHRWRVASGAIALSILAVVAPLVRWTSLPSTVATRWNVLGEADATLGRGSFLVLVALVALIGALGPMSAALYPSSTAQVSVFVGYVLSGTACTFSLVVTVANDGLSTWRSSESSPLALVAGIAASLVAGGVAGHFTASPRRRRRFNPHAPLPDVRFAGHRWNRAVAGASLVLLVVGMVVGAESRLAGAVVVFAAIVLACLARVDLDIDRHGIDLRLSPWHLPHFHLPLRDVRTVDVLSADDMGRPRLRLGATTILHIARGPALAIEFDGDRRFVIGVDDPDAAAAALHRLLDVLRDS